MPSSFEIFKKQLDDAIDIIDDKALIEKKQVDLPQGNSSLIDTESLLARCESVCQKYEGQKPTIRIIHHLACSGGTLISKCISAMPNVHLLSEVHPFTRLHIGDCADYAPTDLIKLADYACLPNLDDLKAKIFNASVREISEHINNTGGKLVLRDHSHSDFCTRNVIPQTSVLSGCLERDFQVISVLTVRNPVDSFASLRASGWIHFEPGTFDEYCRRFLLFTESISPECIFLYEDFVSKPLEQMKLVSSALQLTFNEDFEYLFDLFKVTGDSGRKGSLIGLRNRRKFSKDYIEEIHSSKHYGLVCEKYGYDYK